MGWDRWQMIIINKYILYDNFAESYFEHPIPEMIELSLSKVSYVLSVWAERTANRVVINAYVEEQDTIEKQVKKFALVTTKVPEDGIGWQFINSITISVGPITRQEHKVYHAYIKIC